MTITDTLRDAEPLARAVVGGTPDALAEFETMRLDLSPTRWPAWSPCLPHIVPSGVVEMASRVGSDPPDPSF
jgi:hypothetical protein